MKKNSTKKWFNKIFFINKYFLFCIDWKQKNPIATIENLKASAENGSLLSIIGFVVINADDQSNINMNGKILTILNNKSYQINLRYLR